MEGLASGEALSPSFGEDYFWRGFLEGRSVSEFWGGLIVEGIAYRFGNAALEEECTQHIHLQLT
ncbi:hypothetical protein J0A71_04g10050 [Encephalitozoon cuniculi]|nr:hypothetical protein J0A71_01g00010 [Encephalitozoon cuniculi]UYI26910.1 hypothetical protein J0A71_04g07520 [Encephalitozoon cuniculi]UYI27151.1 hypothetical protein J0A71_04g10050 [Encephalitozoon cuniculi]